MLILALDTTTRAGSVAVLRHDDVLAGMSGDAALTHGQRLPGDLLRTLEAAGVGIAQVDLLAVVAGPGSFTGLRVGIASMQGLAFARGLEIVPVSSLEAIASHAAATSSGPLLAPWVDAQRGEVFASLYTPAGDEVIEAATAAAPAATLGSWRQSLGTRPVRFSGDGAVRYREVIAATLGAQAVVDDTVPALAVPAGRLAARAPHRAVVPHAVVPIYVRRSDAELARERQPR